jgi:hypothetical protein
MPKPINSSTPKLYTPIPLKRGVYRVPITLPDPKASKNASSITEYDVVQKTPTGAVCLGFESVMRSNPPDGVSTITMEFIYNDNGKNRQLGILKPMNKNYQLTSSPSYSQGYTNGVYKCDSKSLKAVENLPENKPKAP